MYVDMIDDNNIKFYFVIFNIIKLKLLKWRALTVITNDENKKH